MWNNAATATSARMSFTVIDFINDFILLLVNIFFSADTKSNRKSQSIRHDPAKVSLRPIPYKEGIVSATGNSL